MANTTESLSPLAERLHSRNARGVRVGSGSRLFERFGVQNPYDGGAVEDGARTAEFSFLSSEDYFAELRGLSEFRRRLLGRVATERSRLRGHDRFTQSLSTPGVRSLRVEAPELLSPTLVDWSTQLEAEAVPEERTEQPMARKGRRGSAAERALRADIARATGLLGQLQDLASISRDGAGKRIRETLASLATLPETQQADAAHRLVRTLKGVSAVAARSTGLARTQNVEADGARPLAIAQRRQDGTRSAGLRRQLGQSPLLMEVEQSSARPPVQRRLPEMVPALSTVEDVDTETVSAVARDARNQASVGRAGPPVAARGTQVPPHRTPRFTQRAAEKAAQVADKAASAPLNDTSRGPRMERASASERGLARLARRSSTAMVSTQGRVSDPVAHARPVAERERALPGAAFAFASPDVPSVPEANETVAAAPRRRASKDAPSASPARRSSVTSARSVPSVRTSTPTRAIEASGDRSVSASRRADSAAFRPMAGAVARATREASSETLSGSPFHRSEERSGTRSLSLIKELAPADLSLLQALPERDAVENEAPARAGRTRPTAVKAAALRGDAPVKPRAHRGDAAPSNADALQDGVGASVVSAVTARPGRSAQASVVGEASGSRRGRATATVRAASRALAQERHGIRGRAVAPSVSAHTQVHDARDAVGAGPVRIGRAAPEMALALPETPSLATEGVEVEAQRRRQPALRSASTPAVERRGASAKGREASVDVARPGSTGARLANMARASVRATQRAREGVAGRMLSPQAIAPFHQEAAPSRLRDAQEAVPARLRESRLGEDRLAASPATDRVLARSEDAAIPGQRALGRMRPGREDVGRGTADVPSVAGSTVAERVSKNVLAEPLEFAHVEAEPESQLGGQVERASRRGTEVPAAIRRSVVPAATPERAQSARAQAAQAAVRGQRTPGTYADPARVVRTETGRTPTMRGFRSPDGTWVAAGVYQTGAGEWSPARRGIAPLNDSSDLARPSSSGRVDPEMLFARAEQSPEELNDVEGGVSRALRRAAPNTDAPSRRHLAPNPVLGAPSPSTDVHTGSKAPGERQQALASSALRPLAGARAPERSERESIAGAPHRRRRQGSSRLREALESAGTVRASNRAHSSVLTLPAAQRGLGDEGAAPGSKDVRYQARVERSAEGAILRTVVEDLVTGKTLMGPASQAVHAESRTEGFGADGSRGGITGRREAGLPQGRRERTPQADTRFVQSAALDVDAPPSELARNNGRSFGDTMEALSGAPKGRRPLLRRRARDRRGMAAEMGLLAPSLGAADFAPDAGANADAPSYARRAVSGTGAVRNGEGVAADGTVTRAQARPDVQEASGLMSALARLEAPADLVKVIVDRKSEIRDTRRELPADAVKLMEQISTFDGPELDMIRRGQRVMEAAPEQNMLQSRNRKGFSSPTQLSAGQDGMGSSRVMKLADKLMGLIHLAENSRRKDAQDQVRMAGDSSEARAEGGAKFPGLSVEDQDMNIEALQKSVLDSVLESLKELEGRREGDYDGLDKWW